MKAVFRMEVGRLMLQDVREVIRRCAFYGYPVTCHEGPGWLSKEILLKGTVTNVQIVRRAIATTVGFDGQ